MLLEGRDFGYDVAADNPDILKVELESEIYNYFMSLDIYRGYSTFKVSIRWFTSNNN